MRINRLIHVFMYVSENVVWLFFVGEPFVIRDLRNVVSDERRNLADPGQRWINATSFKVRLGNLVGERMRRCKKDRTLPRSRR